MTGTSQRSGIDWYFVVCVDWTEGRSGRVMDDDWQSSLEQKESISDMFSHAVPIFHGFSRGIGTITARWLGEDSRRIIFRYIPYA